MLTNSISWAIIRAGHCNFKENAVNTRANDDEDDEDSGRKPPGETVETQPEQVCPGQPTGDIREPDPPGNEEEAEQDRRDQLEIMLFCVGLRATQPFA
jgi:hypothetical protein